MTEFISENELPINRVAKKKLLKARQVAWSESLYVLQLMRWALEQCPNELQLQDRDIVLRRVLRLHDASPRQTMACLQQGGSGAGASSVLDATKLSRLSPSQAAQVLLQALPPRLDAQHMVYGMHDDGTRS